MKREIKFRAWDKDKKYWYNPIHEAYKGNLWELMVCFGGVLCVHTLTENKKESLLMDESTFPDRYELMQFTGLKDKNGKEIYEGDIVEFYDPYTKSNHITDVIWDNENCRYAMKYTYVDFDFLIADEIEVIGNIFENPELLK